MALDPRYAQAVANAGFVPGASLDSLFPGATVPTAPINEWGLGDYLDPSARASVGPGMNIFQTEQGPVLLLGEESAVSGGDNVLTKIPLVQDDSGNWVLGQPSTFEDTWQLTPMQMLAIAAGGIAGGQYLAGQGLGGAGAATGANVGANMTPVMMGEFGGLGAGATQAMSGTLSALTAAGVPENLAVQAANTVAGAMSQGIPAVQAIAQGVQSISSALPGPVKSMLGRALSSVFGDSVAGAIDSALGGGLLQGAGMLAMGMDLADRYRSSFNELGDQYAGLGDQYAGRMNDLADLGYNAYRNLGQTTADNWQNFGDTAAGRWNDAAGQTLDYYTNAGQGAADRWSSAGAGIQGQYNTLATQGQGMFQGLGETAQGRFNEVGSRWTPQFQALGAQAQGQATGIGNQAIAGGRAIGKEAADMIGEFKPYTVSNNVGTFDESGKWTLNAPMQGVNDAATQASRSSFDAANAFDLNNYRQQEYDLMQSLYKDTDAENFAMLNDRKIATGRGGIQSFNQAHSQVFTDPNTGTSYTVGAAPEDVAFFKGLKQRDLQSFLTADDSAMKRRGQFIDQGNAAMTTPLNLAQMGNQTGQLAGTLGKYAADTRAAGAGLFANAAMSGLTTGTNALLKGVDLGFQGGLAGLNFGSSADLSGVNARNTADLAGIENFLGDTRRGIGTNVDFTRSGLGTQDNLVSAGLSGARADRNAGLTAQDTAGQNAIRDLYNSTRDGMQVYRDLVTKGEDAKLRTLENSIITKARGADAGLRFLSNVYMALSNMLGQTGGDAPESSIQGLLGQIIGMTGSVENAAQVIDQVMGEGYGVEGGAQEPISDGLFGGAFTGPVRLPTLTETPL